MTPTRRGLVLASGILAALAAPATRLSGSR
jgi:hypothetical protein